MSNKRLAGLVTKMYSLIQTHHKGQMYGDKDYLFHLYQVFDKCEDMFRSREGEVLWSKILQCEVDSCKGMELDDFKNIVRCVALGHDIIEDTPMTQSLLINAGFTQTIVSSIVAISKRSGETPADYIGRCMADPIAAFVKKADTLCNLSNSVLDGDTARIYKYTRQLDALYNGFSVEGEVKVTPVESQPIYLSQHAMVDGELLERSHCGTIKIKVQQKMDLKLNLQGVSDDVTIFTASGLKEHNYSLIKGVQRQFINHNM